jgi:hypothetical protein
MNKWADKRKAIKQHHTSYMHTCIPNNSPRTVPKCYPNSSIHNNNTCTAFLSIKSPSSISSLHYSTTDQTTQTEPNLPPSGRPVLRHRSSSSRSSRRTPQRQQREQSSDNRSVAESDAGITRRGQKVSKLCHQKVNRDSKSSRFGPSWNLNGTQYLLSSNSIIQIRESEIRGRAAEPGRDGGDEAVAEGGVGGCCYVEFPVVW